MVADDCILRIRRCEYLRSRAARIHTYASERSVLPAEYVFAAKCTWSEQRTTAQYPAFVRTKDQARDRSEARVIPLAKVSRSKVPLLYIIPLQ